MKKHLSHNFRINHFFFGSKMVFKEEKNTPPPVISEKLDAVEVRESELMSELEQLRAQKIKLLEEKNKLESNIDSEVNKTIYDIDQEAKAWEKRAENNDYVGWGNLGDMWIPSIGYLFEIYEKKISTLENSGKEKVKHEMVQKLKPIVARLARYLEKSIKHDGPDPASSQCLREMELQLGLASGKIKEKDKSKIEKTIAKQHQMEVAMEYVDYYDRAIERERDEKKDIYEVMKKLSVCLEILQEYKDGKNNWNGAIPYADEMYKFAEPKIKKLAQDTMKWVKEKRPDYATAYPSYAEEIKEKMDKLNF